MGAGSVKALLTTLLGLILVASLGSASTSGQDGTVSALILTTAGEVADGELIGIDPTIHLDASSLTNYVGPLQAFDIPRSAIRQITLDFPRMVVETDDRVFVGPFSAYSGLSELLFLEHQTKRVAIPTISVRAIALHGYGFHPVSREWLGSTFLVIPLSTARSALTLEGKEAPAGPSKPVISPEAKKPSSEVPEEPEQETPGWVGLLVIAALIALVYFSLSLGGS